MDPDEKDKIAHRDAPVSANTFLNVVAGKAASDISQHFAEGVRAWRSANLTKAAIGAKAILDSRSVDPEEVPPRILWPMLDRMSLNDDETLAKRWAALLANAADPNFADDVHPTYSAILSDLSPLDAVLISWAYRTHCPFQQHHLSLQPFDFYDLEEETGRTWTRKEIQHSASVLTKNNVFSERRAGLDVDKLKDAVQHWANPDKYSRWVDFSSHHKFKDAREGVAFTVMGAFFARAVMPDETSGKS